MEFAKCLELYRFRPSRLRYPFPSSRNSWAIQIFPLLEVKKKATSGVQLSVSSARTGPVLVFLRTQNKVGRNESAHLLLLLAFCLLLLLMLFLLLACSRSFCSNCTQDERSWFYPRECCAACSTSSSSSSYSSSLFSCRKEGWKQLQLLFFCGLFVRSVCVLCVCVVQFFSCFLV